MSDLTGQGQQPDERARIERERRWQRILDCVALKQPDRMPVAMYATYWLARYGGISCKELLYDYDRTAAIAERAVLEFEPDAVAPLVIGTALGRVFDAVGYKQLRWAGHGVGDRFGQSSGWTEGGRQSAALGTAVRAHRGEQAARQPEWTWAGAEAQPEQRQGDCKAGVTNTPMAAILAVRPLGLFGRAA